MTKTHNEIMCEEGFEVVNRKRRKLQPRTHCNEEEEAGNSVSEERVRLSIQNAHDVIRANLDEEQLISTIRAVTGFENFLVRAIGMGNFGLRGSDSSLQMAVLERIISEFNGPPCFYQEPRCTDPEARYLKSTRIDLLPPDTLNDLPTEILNLIKDNPSECICLVFMIHFDHFGFERILASFERIDFKSLVFIGNTVPIDYKGELRTKLEEFDTEDVKMPPSSSSNTMNKSTLWWRKAFSNTCIYCHKNLKNRSKVLPPL